MKDKETPAVKPRKLQKIDEYRRKIPIAWRYYQREIEKKAHPARAEREAMKAVYPNDPNRYTILKTWKKHGLWPVVAENLTDKRLRIFGQKESRNRKRNGLTVISGGSNKKLKQLKEPSENSDHRPELSEKEILQRVKKILVSIEVHEKEWTGGRMKKYSTLKKRIFAGRIPVDLINEIHKFKGSNTYHLEKALRLYVNVMSIKG